MSATALRLALPLLLAALLGCSDPAAAGSPNQVLVPDEVDATGAPPPESTQSGLEQTEAETRSASQAATARANSPFVAPEPEAPVAPTGPAALVVFVEHQWLELQRGGVPDRGWPVSTSEYGIGNQAGSNRTPLGRHRVSEVFGDGAPLGAIFEARRDTGRIATITTDATDTDDDHVTTRVLWLEGLEPGVNSGPGIDSKQRYIYIHGTPEEGLIGRPASHGCIRMKNADVVELFELVDVGTPVTILE